jgi:hypothetical protein
MTNSSIKILLQFLLFTVIILAASAENRLDKLDSKAFLLKARNPDNRTWCAMDGKAIHRKSGSDTASAPLYLGIVFNPDRMLAQVVIDNKEGYTLGQAYAGNDSTTVIPLNPDGYKKSTLSEFGLRAQDLSMSFLYWNFEKELAREDIKGSECRVFILQEPKHGEIAKVYINSQYCFPMKVEWFKKYVENEEPYRTLEAASFKKEKDLWIVNKLKLYGPGWRTNVEFDNIDVGVTAENIPKKLFRELPDIVVSGKK